MTYNNFGITEKSYALIQETLKKFPEIEKAIIFGCRAMGNYKRGSDIDLVITGRDATGLTALNLSSLLNEELPIPYKFDIISYNQINNKELKKHIDTEGKIFLKNLKS